MGQITHPLIPPRGAYFWGEGLHPHPDPLPHRMIATAVWRDVSGYLVLIFEHSRRGPGLTAQGSGTSGARRGPDGCSRRPGAPGPTGGMRHLVGLCSDPGLAQLRRQPPSRTIAAPAAGPVRAQLPEPASGRPHGETSRVTYVTGRRAAQAHTTALPPPGEAASASSVSPRPRINRAGRGLRVTAALIGSRDAPAPCLTRSPADWRLRLSCGGTLPGQPSDSQ